MREPEETRADIRQRLIRAAPESVFAAFSDPGRLARWWGPEGFTSTFEEFDLKPSGRWRFTMHGPDGKDYWNESVFTQIVPNSHVIIEHGAGHHFFLTISFEASGENTLVGWRQVFDTAEHYQQIAEFVANANEQNLDRLTAEVARGNLNRKPGI